MNPEVDLGNGVMVVLGIAVLQVIIYFIGAYKKWW